MTPRHCKPKRSARARHAGAVVSADPGGLGSGHPCPCPRLGSGRTARGPGRASSVSAARVPSTSA
eukprot:11158764-Lingulodinium_polyedra.AAC.1